MTPAQHWHMQSYYRSWKKTKWWKVGESMNLRGCVFLISSGHFKAWCAVGSWTADKWGWGSNCCVWWDERRTWVLGSKKSSESCGRQREDGCSEKPTLRCVCIHHVLHFVSHHLISPVWPSPPRLWSRNFCFRKHFAAYLTDNFGGVFFLALKFLNFEGSEGWQLDDSNQYYSVEANT